MYLHRNRGRSSKHYRHRASPDCNTVASFGSSSSESRGGLNRYYRQAWENLHETAGHKTNHPPLRRKETLDEPGYRENYRGNNTERDGSELVVSDVATYPTSKHASISDKKRHHHHHHHHHGNSTPEWRQSQSHHRYWVPDLLSKILHFFLEIFSESITVTSCCDWIMSKRFFNIL